MSKFRFDQIAINSTEKKKPEENDKYTYLGLEHLDSGSLKVYRYGTDVAPIGEKLIMRKGDVLFGRRRAYLKKVAIAPFDGIFSAHGMVLRPQEKVVTKSFFPFFISSDYFLDDAIKISVGSLSPTINWRDLRELEFSLPSLQEQEKSAKVLWAINDTIEAYRELLAESDKLINALFDEMIRNSDQSNVLGDFIKRYSPKRCGDRDLPVLSVTKEKAIVFQEERFDSTVASKDKSNYLVVPRGYIVQGIHIDEGNFGLQSIAEEGIVSPAYKIWEITSKDILPELLEYYLRSPRAINYYNMNFQGTTVKRRQTIKAADLLAMPLNLPDKSAQVDFWNCVCQGERAKEVLLKTIYEAKQLMKKIIDECFEKAREEV